MIEIKNLNKSFKSQTIFKDASFTFPNRGLYTIMAPSGTGKTTLLNLLSGFDTDYTGEISVLGRDLSILNEEDKSHFRHDTMGFIFQDYLLLDHYSVQDNILLTLEKNKTNMETCQNLLKTLNMEDKVHQKTKTLSGGEKQRVAIARALINNPGIILADEPTGALDRHHASEIMKIFKEIAKERLVILITHDPLVSKDADETIYLENNKIIGPKLTSKTSKSDTLEKLSMQSNLIKRSVKNFTSNIKKYGLISILIALSISGILMASSFENVIQNEITAFQEKNNVLQNGTINTTDQKISLEKIQEDKRLENVYAQYKLFDLNLSYEDQNVLMEEKFPTAKSKEQMSYGKMPDSDKSEIALSPSIAKKLATDISQLIGKDLTFTYLNKNYTLTVTGIYNASYDDFVISSKIEKQLYEDTDDKTMYAISYDVVNFEEIPQVHQDLVNQDIVVQDASMDVENLLNTFNKMRTLFTSISIIITAVSFFITLIILIKNRNTRFKEMALYAVLGFKKQDNLKLILLESFYLALLSFMGTLFLTATILVFSPFFKLSLGLTAIDILISALSSLVTILLVQTLISLKLVQTEPAVALRK